MTGCGWPLLAVSVKERQCVNYGTINQLSYHPANVMANTLGVLDFWLINLVVVCVELFLCFTFLLPLISLARSTGLLAYFSGSLP